MSNRRSDIPRPQFGPAVSPPGKARILILSQRGLTRQLSRCCGYEFEDVITAMDRADLLAPDHSRSSRHRLRLRNRLSRLGLPIRSLPSGLRAEPQQASYDLFFVLVQFPWDLMSLDAVPRWRRRSGLAVCVIEELWTADVKRFGPQLKVLKQFDHVYCGCAGTVRRLSEYLGRNVEYLPPGVDAIRFCPDPRSDARCIDVCAIGRNAPDAHAALLQHANATGAFYLYDSLEPPRTARVPHEHRLLLANQIKHSRYFIARRAKFDRGFETAGQEEVGLRFFEGVAGGAVLLGERPRSPRFAELLGWEDSVIEVGQDPADLLRAMAGLDAEPLRVNTIRRRNVHNSLRRHDWLHRWAEVLDRAGLEQEPGMRRRRDDLETLARLFDTSGTAVPLEVAGPQESPVALGQR